MLAHVLQALDGPGRSLQVTEVDLCPTALQLNRWYARRIGRAIEVECADLLDHAREDSYDLVITSSLLGFIEPRQRPGLFAMFARNLRRGGSVVLSNRLRDAAPDQPLPLRPGDAERFADLVAARAGQLPEPGLEKQDAWRMAMAYATLRRPYPVNGFASIECLAAGAGLHCAQALALRSPALRPGVHGLTLGDGSPYVMVTLTRPAA